ncbi:MAG: hypothetical protein BRD55_01100 [Bacteroidetes bacterium SW_9_63_38]|nr:MAG: hypothetical protein BRD55_01100 [Bacteroidetes bacterium SW_9_63_38]
MVNVKFNPKSSIVLLLSAYFVVGYAAKTNEVEKIVPGATLIPLGILVIGGGYLFSRSVARKPFGLFPTRLRLFYVYVAVSLVLLVVANLNSLRPAYSISRAILSIGILALSIIFFWQALRVMEQTEMRSGSPLTYSLLALLVILLLGQLTIPEWAAGVGGVRMSGGSNPNQVAFLAFFAIFWAHYSALKNKLWKKREKALYVIAFIVLAWSLSRSVILTFASLYFMYFGIIGALHLSRFLRGRIQLGFLRKMAAAGILCLSILPAMPAFKETVYILRDLQKVEQRLSGESGLQTRLRAWKDVWPYFIEAPLTGHAGWWNSTDLISQKGGPKTATSPHNLYVRLLSEVGVFGFLVVLSLPILLFYTIVSKLVLLRSRESEFKVEAFLASSIIAVFIGQGFEDRYMVGLGGIGSGIVYFILCCSINKVVYKYGSRE